MDGYNPNNMQTPPSRLANQGNNTTREYPHDLGLDDFEPNSMGDKNNVTTKFIIGEKRGNTFYHPKYSNQKYYYINGNIVKSGTKLHHHTVPQNGRSNFMTQHDMDGKEQDVTPTKPKRKKKIQRRPSSLRNNITIPSKKRTKRGLNSNGMTARSKRASKSSITKNKPITNKRATTVTRKKTTRKGMGRRDKY